MTDTLRGIVAVVAGATRGGGRAIACELGAAGATVYCTGRSTRGNPATAGRPETIEETAAMVSDRGGAGIPVRVDHTRETEVDALFERVAAEQNGRLDILVNDVWGGDELTEWDRPFWQVDVAKARLLQERAVLSHLITARSGAPWMVARGRGLILEITDGANYKYRGNLPYSLAKVATIHLAEGMAADLERAGLAGITALAVTPGFLRSEAVLDHFGVSEANWHDGIAKDPYFAASETPYYLGRAVVALASDPNVGQKAGRALTTWDLAQEYGFTDVDGSQPDWGAFFAAHPLGTL